MVKYKVEASCLWSNAIVMSVGVSVGSVVGRLLGLLLGEVAGSGGLGASA